MWAKHLFGVWCHRGQTLVSVAFCICLTWDRFLCPHRYPSGPVGLRYGHGSISYVRYLANDES